MAYIIRPAHKPDCAALTALGRETFTDTYAAHNTEEDLRLHLDRTYTAARQLAEIEDTRWRTLVATAGDALVGFSQGRFEPLPTGVESPGRAARLPWEIHRFYVHRDWHGRGLAQAMMQHTTAAALAAGADAIWLGVWSNNPRACAFYVKCGFEQIGETTFTLGTDVQRDFVMFKRLATR